MPKQESEMSLDPLDGRVLRSLYRLGLESVPVTDLGNGVVQLDLGRAGSDDRAMATAIARSVPGVTKVLSDRAN